MSEKISIGDIIKFGQNEWCVLDVQNGQVLLLSKGSVCNNEFKDDDVGIICSAIWENSDIREYLNGDFLQYITNGNPDLVIETKINNDDNLWCVTEGGEDTFDKIFLLSLEEADRYFGNSGDYLNIRLNKYWDEDRKEYDGICITNDHDSSRKITDGIFKYMGWWLRSPGKSKYDSAYVDNKGKIVVTGESNTDTKNVRPALWIKLELAEKLKNGATIEEINSMQEINPVKQILSDDEKIEFGPYIWRILEVQGDNALIITEDIVSERTYHPPWEKCYTRSYLNGKFLEKFTDEEQKSIIETKITNLDNQWFDTNDNASTNDKVFLLSIEEADKYFGNSGDYISKRQKKYGGAKEEPGDEGRYLSNIYNNDRIATFKDKPLQWWLRSSGSEKECLTYYPGGQIKGSDVNTCSVYVDKNGSIDVFGVTDREYNPKYKHYNIEWGVRPVLRLQGYQEFLKSNKKPTEPEVWPPETEPSKQQLMRKISAMENASYIYHEGYVYFIPKDGELVLMKARSDGKEEKTIYSTGNESGQSSGWHRSEYFSFAIEKIEDGYLYLKETCSGDNDYSEWNDSCIYRLKLDGTDKFLKYIVSRKRNDPGGAEHYTQYYDEDGNLERTEHH